MAGNWSLVSIFCSINSLINDHCCIFSQVILSPCLCYIHTLLFLLSVCHSCKDIVPFKAVFSFPNRHMQMPRTLDIMTASVNVFVYRKKYISLNYRIFLWVRPSCNTFSASFALLLCSEYLLYKQIRTLKFERKKKEKGIERHQK